MPLSSDTSPGSVRRRAILAAIGALIIGLIFAYNAASNEITGSATYRRGVGRGSPSRSERVRREDSPLKFREATNLLWGLSGCCLIVSAASFWYYRKLDEDVDDYF